MTYPSRHAAATDYQHFNAFDLDRFAIDDEFDDELDLQLAALRESPADFRNA